MESIRFGVSRITMDGGHTRSITRFLWVPFIVVHNGYPPQLYAQMYR